MGSAEGYCCTCGGPLHNRGCYFDITEFTKILNIAKKVLSKNIYRSFVFWIQNLGSDKFTTEEPTSNIIGKKRIKINDILTTRFSLKIFKISFFIIKK